MGIITFVRLVTWQCGARREWSSPQQAPIYSTYSRMSWCGWRSATITSRFTVPHLSHEYFTVRSMEVLGVPSLRAVTPFASSSQAFAVCLLGRIGGSHLPFLHGPRRKWPALDWSLSGPSGVLHYCIEPLENFAPMSFALRLLLKTCSGPRTMLGVALTAPASWRRSS